MSPLTGFALILVKSIPLNLSVDANATKTYVPVRRWTRRHWLMTVIAAAALAVLGGYGLVAWLWPSRSLSG